LKGGGLLAERKDRFIFFKHVPSKKSDTPVTKSGFFHPKWPKLPECPEEPECPELPPFPEPPEGPEIPEEPEFPQGPCPENAMHHVIQAGDTFWKLAKVYGTTVESIVAANPDVDPLNLQIGDIICIPVGIPGAKG
jgi:nucleoid-associated protein YgaU